MPSRAGQFIFSFMLFAFLSSESASEIQSVGPDDEVILSLHQADIQDLVRWASAVTEKTIIIHPAVSGRVTVIAGDPMSRDVAYQTFLSVLKIHGFAVIQSGQSLVGCWSRQSGFTGYSCACWASFNRNGRSRQLCKVCSLRFQKGTDGS